MVPRFYGRIETFALTTVARGPVPRDRRSARKSPAAQGRFLDRGMARDRPSPYGSRTPFLTRSAGACPPRSSMCPIAWRGTGPRPTMKGAVLSPVARGPSDAIRACERVSPAIADLRENRQLSKAVSPTDGMARDRPSPYGSRTPFLARSAGACPPRSSVCPMAWRGTGHRPTV